MDRLIPSREDDPRKAVELLKLHWWWWVNRHYAHNGALDLRRGPKVVLPNVPDMVDLRVELHVGG